MPSLEGDAPHIAHAKDAALLRQHVAHSAHIGDKRRSATLEAELKVTEQRRAFADRAALLCDGLGLTNEITKDTITYNDAVHFVAKVLHEVLHEETRSHYARSHAHLIGVNEGEHIDDVELAKPFDPAHDVIEHLGLEKAEDISAVTEFFQGKVG
jgi:hypothetical protein